MLRAKTRSGSIDVGHKNHSSIFSRSKLCRGDVIASQIDSKAIVSVDNKPTKPANLSQEKRANREAIMEEQMEQLVEELNRTKENLVVAEGEKERLIDEIKKMKQEAKVEEMKMYEANELNAEIGSLKELLSNSKDESKQKDGKIESLEMELRNVNKLEIELSSRDSLIDGLRQELDNVRESESRGKDLSAGNEKRIMELEAEVEKGKISEHKMLESLQHQTKLLEETKIELQRVGSRDVSESRNIEHIVQSTEDVESLKSELQRARDQLAQALDSERIATMKIKHLQDELALAKNEVGLVKNELKQATGAEETSKKAMDELAIALTEVATESNQVKEKLQGTLLELEHVKDESEKLKDMVRSTEERYQKLLDEAKKESELYRNTADRLRLEAEESLLAWNGKEMGFVTCIKKAEEEKAVVQHEKSKLAEALKSAENLTRSAREENHKLRDILKQAINESNAAKSAAGIAKDENSLLKDSLSEKEEELLILHKENERLRINEVAAKENLKEFKQLLAASMELKIDNKETTAKLKSSSSDEKLDKVDEEEYEDKDEDEDDDEEENKEKKNFSFDFDELNFIDDKYSAIQTSMPEDPEKAEALKGSIFDSDYSPKSEPRTPISLANHERCPSQFMREMSTLNPEDHGIVDGHLYDVDCDRNNCRRKKALFRRVSEIIMRKKMIQ